jgi:hypothetical protein
VQPPSGWIKTADQSPTESDANRYEYVIAADGDFIGCVKWFEVNGSRKWSFWMPIPPVPGASQTATQSGENKDL